VSERLVKAVAWRRLDILGTELGGLSSTEVGWGLQGLSVVLLDREFVSASYEVSLDRSFGTRAARVWVLTKDTSRAVQLRVADGQWRRRVEVRPARFDEAHVEMQADRATRRSVLDGCVDVDIGFTPSTNTLPIRRLQLEVGESADVDAAWVRFPELTVERLRQRYTRVAHDRYRYESLDGDFTAELVVDDDGLVVTYEGLWERVGETTG